MQVRSGRAAGGAPCVTVFAEDRGPLPLVVEDDSEEAWQEYDACCAALEAQLRQLRNTLDRAPAGSHARLRDIEARFTAELARGIDVDEVMALARRGRRVCPTPGAWRALYLLLPVVREGTRVLRAPYPVDLLEWHQTTDLQKQLRLREQLDWAQAHGGLERVRDFLAALRETDWVHAKPVDWPAI